MSWLSDILGFLFDQDGREEALATPSDKNTKKPSQLFVAEGVSISDRHKEKLSPKLASRKKYVEKYRRSPNQSGSIKPKFIVIHHSAGSYAGTVSWILNAASDVSYHYVINPKDGTRVQHVFDKKKAWHAGRSKWKGYSGLNSWSVSIAFSGDTYKREVSDVEIDSCAKKCIYLMNKFNLKIEDIITHEMIAPKRKNDCSPEVYQRVIARVKVLKRFI